jgi:hypothetical protein
MSLILDTATALVAVLLVLVCARRAALALASAARDVGRYRDRAWKARVAAAEKRRDLTDLRARLAEVDREVAAADEKERALAAEIDRLLAAPVRTIRLFDAEEGRAFFTARVSDGETRLVFSLFAADENAARARIERRYPAAADWTTVLARASLDPLEQADETV